MIRLLRAFIFKNRPVYVHYGITHRCNLHCRMCKIYQNAKADEEVSLEEIGRIFDFLKSLGIIYVSIGGGEPFLREDLSLVIKLLKRKGFFVRLLTNGMLAEKDSTMKLTFAGLREISVSLDSLDARKQDYICNKNGAWEKIMQSIELFSSFLPKKKRFMLINTTVSPLNIMELPELSRFAQRKGWYISFIPIESNSSFEFSFKKDDYPLIDKSYNYLMETKKKGRSNIFNSSLFLEKSRQYLKSGEADWACDAGKFYFSMNPKGELSICHRFQPGESLLEKNSKDFFKSSRFINTRNKLIKDCSGCMRPCWAEVSFFLRDKKSFREMLKIQTLRFKL